MTGNPAAASCAVKELLSLFKVTTVEGGYTMKQVFILDEIGLLWKLVAIYNFLSVNRKTAGNATHCCWEEMLLGTTNRASQGVSFTESMGTELIHKN
jgi:hypothetical protein